MSRNWTAPQQTAIDDRGGTLLVSAAAGSGKTAVLVERVVGIISDNETPVELSQLLIVTFSNAAAAEMRQRIGVRLSQLIAQNPKNYYLQKQQNMLGSARIKTIHAFCMDLIRQNFQYLPISPDFAIMDQREQEFLRNTAVMDCVERFYKEDETGEFSDLVELLTSGRDDKRLIDTVFKIYDFARSHPFYESWLDSQLERYDTTKNASETLWGKSLLSYTKETLNYSLSSLKETRELLLGDERLEKAYLPAWDSDIAQLEVAIKYIIAGDWDAAVKALRDFDFVNLGRATGQDSNKTRAKDARDYAKKLIKDLPVRYLNATEKEFKEDIKDLRPKVGLLFALVKDFGETLDNLKAVEKKLDFSDLEHLALQLLVEKEGNKYIRTEQAEEISDQYKWVLIDEYQDTNEVQDLIFDSLSRDGENLFMVGDVKQSIYSFRLAMPEIFMKRKDLAFAHNSMNYPARIVLDTNFRSRSQVTGGVNYIFRQIMSDDMGEVDYNQQESLKCGAEYPDHPNAESELILVNAQEYDGEEDNTRLEAVEVARKIKAMLGEGFQVAEGKGMRSAVPGDFCVLMRSPRGRAETYLKALQEVGISAQTESTSGFLQSREISSIMCLLRIIDNPLLDVELAAVMLSPLFSFTPDDIAEIRIASSRVPLYTAVKNAAKGEDEKSGELLKIFDSLRYYATTHMADELILEALRLTNWMEIVGAMSFGNSRQANLLLLVEHATYYHQMGYKGLGGFVSLVNRVEEQGSDLDSAGTLGESKNMVRIMSVHRSKGLEFPIVILADTARRFNLQDLRENTLLHSKYGFACVRRDPKALTQFPTIPMGAIRLEMQKTTLSEEMRILYVALTRAKEKLIITGTISTNLERKISRQALDPLDGKLPFFMVGEVTSYIDWLIMALLHHPDADALRDAGALDDVVILADENSWNIEVIQPQEVELEDLDEEQKWTELPNEDVMREIEEKLSFEYLHISRTLVPNKLAVSQVVAMEAKEDYLFTRRPRFMTQQKLTPAERGNAMHKFMQFASYSKAKSNIDDEINRMGDEEFLSPAETESLSREGLSAFFTSSVANRIFESPQVYRELRFITEFGQEELKGVIENIDEDSRVVLQGVADCVFIENGEAVIVDYKTDRVKSLDELLERYRRQLEIYSKIVEKTLDIKVRECILYSFHLSDSVKRTI